MPPRIHITGASTSMRRTITPCQTQPCMSLMIHIMENHDYVLIKIYILITMKNLNSDCSLLILNNGGNRNIET
jgi:hypothetical protein